jgi:hypothetical protein
MQGWRGEGEQEDQGKYVAVAVQGSETLLASRLPVAWCGVTQGNPAINTAVTVCTQRSSITA